MTDVVELTRELVATNTVNPPGHEADAAALVGARLESAGLEVRRHELEPGRESLVARWRGGEDAAALCLTAHLDTVPLGRAEWDHDPFAGEIDGDRLFGRGTSDMKGGLAAIVLAAERVAALGTRRGRARLLHRRVGAGARLRPSSDRHLRAGRRRPVPPDRRVLLGLEARGGGGRLLRDRPALVPPVGRPDHCSCSVGRTRISLTATCRGRVMM